MGLTEAAISSGHGISMGKEVIVNQKEIDRMKKELDKYSIATRVNWTEEMDEILKYGRAKGHSWATLGRVLGYSKSCVRERWIALNENK